MTYLAGVGRRDITPPAEWIDAGRIWLWGFGDRTAPCSAVLDPLDVRALAVRDDGGATAILVSVDVGALDPASTDRIRQRVAAEHGIAGEYVCVNVSHTHNAPVFVSIPTWQPGVALADDGFVQLVEDAVVGAVADALADLQPGATRVRPVDHRHRPRSSPDGSGDGPDARRRAGDRRRRHPDRGRVRRGLPSGRPGQRRQPGVVRFHRSRPQRHRGPGRRDCDLPPGIRRHLQSCGRPDRGARCRAGRGRAERPQPARWTHSQDRSTPG